MAAPREIEELLERLQKWAETRPDLRGLALVGSWARHSPAAGSDIDLVLITEQPDTYVQSDQWITELGGQSILRTVRWGAATERRVALTTGPDLDIGIVEASWAATTPVDEGTARVVSGGIRILFDPAQLFERLVDALQR